MLILALVAAPFLLCAAIAIIWVRQEKIVFQPPYHSANHELDCPLIAYSASDGQKLIAYVVGNPQDDAGLLIAFHGNAVEAEALIPWALEVNSHTGWCVMLPEYRGYAGLDGTPSYTNSRLDARAAHQAAARFLQPCAAQVILFGHSIGSAIATELAADSNPRALLLQSPLSSARDMARIIVARPVAWLWSLISRVHYDTVALVGTLDVPVWVAHGARDLITPVSMGRRVHAAARKKGSILIVQRAAHNDVPERGGADYWNWFTAAVAKRSL